MAGKDENKVDETLRWPIALDRAAIERRLAEVREVAQTQGLTLIVDLFSELPRMSSADLGASVVTALTWLQDKPEHRPITMQLEMIAMNLKNLKKPKKSK